MVCQLASKASTGSKLHVAGLGFMTSATFAGALLLTFNVAILFAIPLFGDNPYARD